MARYSFQASKLSIEDCLACHDLFEVMLVDHSQRLVLWVNMGILLWWRFHSACYLCIYLICWKYHYWSWMSLFYRVLETFAVKTLMQVNWQGLFNYVSSSFNEFVVISNRFLIFHSLCSFYYAIQIGISEEQLIILRGG